MSVIKSLKDIQYLNNKLDKIYEISLNGAVYACDKITLDKIINNLKEYYEKIGKKK